MRVMVCAPATKESEAGVMPTEEGLTQMMKFNEELVKAGVLLDGAGLLPTSKAKRVRFSGTQRTVIDGPFAESKELIAGYSIWQVKSIEEAVEWVKRAPLDGGVEVTIRPLFSPEDFGEAATPQLRARGEQLRAESARLKKL
jgi:hypothetical protein